MALTERARGTLQQAEYMTGYWRGGPSLWQFKLQVNNLCRAALQGQKYFPVTFTRGGVNGRFVIGEEVKLTEALAKQAIRIAFRGNFSQGRAYRLRGQIGIVLRQKENGDFELLTEQNYQTQGASSTDETAASREELKEIDLSECRKEAAKVGGRHHYCGYVLREDGAWGDIRKEYTNELLFVPGSDWNKEFPEGTIIRTIIPIDGWKTEALEDISGFFITVIGSTLTTCVALKDPYMRKGQARNKLLARLDRLTAGICFEAAQKVAGEANVEEYLDNLQSTGGFHLSWASPSEDADEGVTQSWLDRQKKYFSF